MLNPYRVLCVPNGSDKNVCKKAYRRLCAKYHPDNGGDADKFDEINKAWGMIESGRFEEINIKMTKRKYVIHSSLFSYSMVG